MKSTAEILREARALIDTPDKWSPHNPDGMCIAIAICEVDESRCIPDAQRILATALDLPDATGAVYEFNDTSEHADVLAAFDRAITLAETQA